MKRTGILLLLIYLTIFTGILFYKIQKSANYTNRFISFRINPKHTPIHFYYANEQGKPLQNIGNLKAYLHNKGKKLRFAMNGGMFNPDYSPVGLYIQDLRIISPLDTASGQGNFYLKPNGVFYIKTDNTPGICITPKFKKQQHIKYATQSGPMLITAGKINSIFKAYSSNLNIRNGVGILPDGQVVFVLSKSEVNFYDFAQYFKKLGCKNALYLDGFVSRMYLPEKNWEQLDGDLGIIIGVTE